MKNLQNLRKRKRKDCKDRKKIMKHIMDLSLQYESLIYGNMTISERIRHLIPEDAFIVDERKIPFLLDGMVIAHAKQMGYPEDKIYILREIKEVFLSDGTSFTAYDNGCLCNETSDEFIDRYQKMGIFPYWHDSDGQTKDRLKRIEQ